MEQETSGCAGLLAAIVNSSFDAIVSQTLEGTVTSWNPAAAKHFGYEAHEMIGGSIRRLIPADRQNEEDQIVARIGVGERVELYETVRLNKNGSPVDVLLTISPIRDSNGKIVGASKIYRDCAPQKKATETLRQSEERLRHLVEQAPAAIAMFDRDMRYLACSSRWLEDYCPDAVSVIGRTHYEVFPEIPERWKEPHRRGLAGEVVRVDEDPFLRADGRTQWLRWELRPWLTSDQAIGGITIFSEDVTERVEAVRALRESELRTHLAQEAAKAGTWELRLADNRSQWSKNTWLLYGLQPGQCAPCFEAWVSTIHPQDRERVTKALREAVAVGKEYETQWRVKLPEGEPTRWLLSRGRPIKGADGAPERYIGVVIDITERKRMEEALHESELRMRLAQERMRLAQEAAKAGTWEWRLAENRDEWSESAWALYGLRPGQCEPSFEAWTSTIHAQDRERIVKTAKEAAAAGREYELQWRVNQPEGEPPRWLFARGRPVAGANGEPECYIGVVIDITERMRQEEALRKAEKAERQKREELEAILAAIPTPVLIAMDASCEEMVGNTAAYDLYRVPWGTNLAKSAPVGQAPANFEIFQNGRHLTGEDLPIRKAAANRAFSGEIELRFVEGDSKYLLGNALPLFDDAGEVRGAVAAFADVTELKRTVAALRDSEELERQKRQELETILAAIPAAVLIAKDAACVEIVGNRATYELLQRAPGSNLSKSVPAGQAPNNFEVFQNGRPLAPIRVAAAESRCERRLLRGGDRNPVRRWRPQVLAWQRLASPGQRRKCPRSYRCLCRCNRTQAYGGGAARKRGAPEICARRSERGDLGVCARNR